MLKCVYCNKKVNNNLKFYLKDKYTTGTKDPVPLPVCNEKHFNLYLLGLVFWYPLPILEN